jgi:hypothetical protein
MVSGGPRSHERRFCRQDSDDDCCGTDSYYKRSSSGSIKHLPADHHDLTPRFRFKVCFATDKSHIRKPTAACWLRYVTVNVVNQAHRYWQSWLRDDYLVRAGLISFCRSSGSGRLPFYANRPRLKRATEYPTLNYNSATVPGCDGNYCATWMYMSIEEFVTHAHNQFRWYPQAW